ncbi:hypothetical protein CK203_111754 [Vitis vinifera]|uniref:BRX domain-containing protein n=1 Tax=Vitis vinifera TaxID=29760 RepID=A0A438DNX6_VITVI|nr:hypothetical protein CK203_111754 [Vitis vinifera]
MVSSAVKGLHDSWSRAIRRRFGEHQAENWWSENREKVYERYNVRGSDKSSVSGQAARRSEGGTHHLPDFRDIGGMEVLHLTHFVSEILMVG